jgi:hypothetical protein
VHITRAILHAGVYAIQLERNAFFQTHERPLHTIIDGSIAILRTLAYVRDQVTRAKIVLEAHRSCPPQEVHSAADSIGVHGAGVKFTAWMGSNVYWDLVESEKYPHNWNQDAEYIFREMVNYEGKARPQQKSHHKSITNDNSPLQEAPL